MKSKPDAPTGSGVRSLYSAASSQPWRGLPLRGSRSLQAPLSGGLRERAVVELCTAIDASVISRQCATVTSLNAPIPAHGSRCLYT